MTENLVSGGGRKKRATTAGAMLGIVTMAVGNHHFPSPITHDSMTDDDGRSSRHSDDNMSIRSSSNSMEIQTSSRKQRFQTNLDEVIDEVDEDEEEEDHSEAI